VPFLLRKIDKENRWWPPTADDADMTWLTADEVQADALVEIQTKQNALSAWFIDDHHSNLQQVVLALAASRDYASDLHYVLLDLADVAGAGLEVQRSEGNTADDDCNGKWHRDIVHLSASKMAVLAKLIHSQKKSRYERKKAIKKLLIQNIENNTLTRSRVNVTLLSHLGLSEEQNDTK